MLTATHSGCKVRVRAGKRVDWGRMFATVNGEQFPVVEKFDEAKALAEIVRLLDAVHAVPVDGDRWPAYYYPPGSYVLCEHGHPVTPGGECTHTYCRNNR